MAQDVSDPAIVDLRFKYPGKLDYVNNCVEMAVEVGYV